MYQNEWIVRAFSLKMKVSEKLTIRGSLYNKNTCTDMGSDSAQEMTHMCRRNETNSELKCTQLVDKLSS